MWADTLHLSHHFHPAGHGTFFSGHIRRAWNQESGDDFTWIYDCGSKRPTHLRGLVSDLRRQLAPRKHVDVVCLSHFDSDHVCGIELLLSEMRVGVLVLPYLSLQARLQIASQVLEEDGAAHQVAAMTLDPSRFLIERGLSENFERIVLVRGGKSAEMAERNGRNPNQPRAEGGGDSLNIQIPSAQLLEEGAAGHRENSRIDVAEHDQPWVIGGLYELFFYNTALDDGAPQSGADLKEIAAEVADIISTYGLCLTQAPQPGWIDELKKCYAKHFGATSKRKNEISLCAIGRPLAKVSFEQCRLFMQRRRHPCEELGVGGRAEVAVLLTGDIGLDAQELIALQNHVGVERWSSVRVMQIPHHGSKKNWEPGTSAYCVHDYSVVCAPPSKNHPHKDVLSDISARNPVVATYDKAVSFDFHVVR